MYMLLITYECKKPLQRRINRKFEYGFYTIASKYIICSWRRANVDSFWSQRHPEKQDLPSTAAIRLLHYAHYIDGFNYDIQCRNTENVDYLSRSPNLVNTINTKEGQQEAYSIFILNQLNTVSVIKNEI